MLDEAAIFLRRSRQEAGNMDEGDDRNVETVAEAHETRASCGMRRNRGRRPAQRLVGDEADGRALDAPEAGDDIPCVRLLDLEEIALVRDLEDQFLDVIGLVGIVGNQRVERGVDPVGIIEARQGRRALEVGGRQE